MTKDEALERARKEELDLVEVAPNADPPVARIIDFQKLRYQENKKEQKSGKNEGGELKELWLSPRIAEHDLQVRLDHAREFFKEGHKVKLTVKFKGREMAHPEFGHMVLQKALERLGNEVAIERDTKFEGRNLSLILTKVKGGIKNAEIENKKSVDKKD